MRLARMERDSQDSATCAASRSSATTSESAVCAPFAAAWGLGVTSSPMTPAEIRMGSARWCALGSMTAPTRCAARVMPSSGLRTLHAWSGPPGTTMSPERSLSQIGEPVSLLSWSQIDGSEPSVMKSRSDGGLFVRCGLRLAALSIAVSWDEVWLRVAYVLVVEGLNCVASVGAFASMVAFAFSAGC